MTPHDYQPLIDRLREICDADERVVALLLLGSHAIGTADTFSDLDIGLVTTDAARDAVVADLSALARSLGEPLFSETFGNPANLHVIYADGSAVELIVFGESEPLIEGPHRTLFDRTGAVERALARPRPPVDPDAAREEVRRLVVWFWHDVEHLIAAIGRGETWWAYGQLDELRRRCLNLARLAAGSPTEADEAYWKVEAAVSPEHLRALERTVAPLELGPMLEAAHALVCFYRVIAPGLAEAHGVPYPTELDRLVTGRLESL